MRLNLYAGPLMSTESASGYSRKNPFPAPHVVNRRLSGPDSEKETRHHEISLAGSGLTYEVGDSLGVFPRNDDKLVQEIIEAIGATGEEQVNGADGQPKSFRQALTTDYVITTPSKELVAAICARGDESAGFLREISTDPLQKKSLEAHLYGKEFIDFITDHSSIKWTPEELVKCMRKLQPRLYSISSSQKAVGENVHLTIATVRYESHGRMRGGVASTFLADRTSDEVKVPVFVHTAKHFRLPEDPSTPIIMVGPGTGIAPFRAFLQDRKASGATGKSWLFFGEQRQASDFLYEVELTQLQQEGSLTRLDVAFSRDIPGQKVYVQHKMAEASKELFTWLEEGAHFFVCGDGARMAKDVDAELQAIISRESGVDAEGAAKYVEELKKSKRYKRDVY
jgi:sulfite reductase (NADPH) flavoprotein alpha-component